MSRLQVLQERDYRRLFFGRTTSLVGDGITPVALAFAILDLTGSATDLGIVIAAHSIVVVALILIGGVVADRISPRLAMLGADLTRTVSMGLIAVLLLTGSAEIWQLTLLYAIDGAATAFFNPASNAIVPQIVPGSRLQEANALLNFSRWGGKVAGPALAGFLLALGSPGTALAVDAVTFLVSAAFLWRIKAPGVRSEEEEGEPFLFELRHGWREFSSRSWMVAVVLGAAVTNAIFFPVFQVLGPTVARESLGGSSAWALIAAMWGAGGLLGGVVALNIRPRRPLLLSESFILLFSIPVVLLAIPASTAAIAIGALFASATVALSEILYETVSAQHIPPESLARVVAYDWFGSLAVEPFTLALVGPVAATIGISTTLWAGVGAMLLCQIGVLSVPSVRRLESRVTPDPVPVPLPRPIEPGD
jgi:MFS family permease